jgi:hypothetical protein
MDALDHLAAPVVDDEADCRRRRCDVPEALVLDTSLAAPLGAEEEGLPIELVGQHLRLSGSVQIGFHRRLSDFINNHEGLIRLNGVTILRRNGDPTKVTAPSIWVSPEEVTLIGQHTDPYCARRRRTGLEKRAHTLIVVTSGHTPSGDVHLNPEAILAAFIESPPPQWIPMTDVRPARSPTGGSSRATSSPEPAATSWRQPRCSLVWQGSRHHLMRGPDARAGCRRPCPSSRSEPPDRPLALPAAPGTFATCRCT